MCGAAFTSFALQKQFGGLFQAKEKEPDIRLAHYVRVTYFHGQGMLSSCRRKCPVDTCRHLGSISDIKEKSQTFV